MNDNVRQLTPVGAAGPATVPVFVSPELTAAREELGILHEMFAALGEARIRAVEHEKAAKVLGYVHALITDAQARHDALLPPEPTQAPATDASPVITTKEPEQSAPAAS